MSSFSCSSSDCICERAGTLIVNRALPSGLSPKEVDDTTGKTRTGGEGELLIGGAVAVLERLGIQMKSEFDPPIVVLVCTNCLLGSSTSRSVSSRFDFPYGWKSFLINTYSCQARSILYGEVGKFPCNRERTAFQMCHQQSCTFASGQTC